MTEQLQSNQQQTIEPEPIDPKAVVRLTFELNQLRQEARHGWLRIGANPESVAEHTQRAAAFGYLLAEMEGFSGAHRVPLHGVGPGAAGQRHGRPARTRDHDPSVVR